MKLKKTYSFTLWSSIYLTISIGSIAIFLFVLLGDERKLLGLLIFIPLAFISSFLITQYRAKRFIYNRIKKIYDEVSILNEDEFHKESATTDIDTLSNPTTEHIVAWIWDKLLPDLDGLTEVTVSESDDSSCTYKGSK